MSHDDEVQRTEVDAPTSIDEAWRMEVKSRLEALNQGELEMLSEEEAMDVIFRRNET